MRVHKNSLKDNPIVSLLLEEFEEGVWPEGNYRDWGYIDGGCSADVFRHEGLPGLVLRVARLDQDYVDYIMFGETSGNPMVPKASLLVDDGDYCLVLLEELQPLPYGHTIVDENYDLVEKYTWALELYFHDPAKQATDWAKRAARKLAKGFQWDKSHVNELRKKIGEESWCFIDLHYGNIMLRDGYGVITDPFP